MIPALLCITLLQLPGQTARPAITAEKYQVTVCLRTAENPLLTPLFVTSVAREVHDQLGNYFGPLAEVKVVTAGHWLADDYQHRPIDVPELLPADLATQPTAEKAFLIHLDYGGGQYEIRSRLIDTVNDQLGPIRTQQTPDRWWVAKAICLAVKNSFSVSAVVTPGDITGTVSLWFQGEDSREQIRSVLGQRCVMQPLWVIEYRDGRTERRPIPRTMLLWDSESPLHSAKVITNLSNPWPQRASIAGFEAVKIDTRSGHLRLRVVDRDTGLPVQNCIVSASDSGFESIGNQDRLSGPDRNGYAISQRAYSHLAYVQVAQGTSVAKVPVAITDQVTDFVIEISSDTASSVKNEFVRALRFLIQDTQTINTVQGQAVAEFNRLNSDKRYEEALAKVSAAIGFIDTRLKTAQLGFGTLQQEADKLGMQNDALFQVAAKQVAGVGERQQEIAKLRDSIELAIQSRDAQQRADVLIGLAKDAETAGDIDQAIANYELALAEQPNQPPVQAKLAQLKEDWRVKGPAHEHARKFLADQWASAVVTEIESLLPQAKTAFATMKTHNDHLGARRLIIVNDRLIGELNSLISQLGQRGGEADAKEAEQYANITGQLADFQGEVAEFVEQALANAPPGNAPPVDPPTSNPPPVDPPTDPPAGDDSSLLDLAPATAEEAPLEP